MSDNDESDTDEFNEFLGECARKRMKMNFNVKLVGVFVHDRTDPTSDWAELGCHGQNIAALE
jgi:hypothetical protein